MSKARPDYILLDHTADLGVRIRGTSPADLFENACKTLDYIIFGIVPPAEKPCSRKISLSGSDLADLMVRWLSEILYLFDGEHLVVANADIHTLSTKDLKATLTTTPFDPDYHEVLREIKAVTYHGIKVTREKGIWTAEVIFDL
jgi:SHS2 domain-containing protein